MNRSPSRQSGMTLISFMLMFVLIGFFMLLILKLAPIYLENLKVTSTLNALQKEPGLVDRSPKEIIAMVQKRWDINSIDRISAADSLTIDKSGGSVRINVDYEVEEHVLANISVLVKFKDSYLMTGGASN